MNIKQYIIVQQTPDENAWIEFASADSRTKALNLARDLPDGTYYLMSVLRSIQVRLSTRVVQKVVELGRTLQPRPRTRVSK